MVKIMANKQAWIFLECKELLHKKLHINCFNTQQITLASKFSRVAFQTPCERDEQSKDLPMTEPGKKSKTPVTENTRTWSDRTIGMSRLMAKEGELAEHLKAQRDWAKEQLQKLTEKKEDFLAVLREQGKWNEEQMGKDWYPTLVDLFAQHHRDVDALVVQWEKRYEDLETKLIET